MNKLDMATRLRRALSTVVDSEHIQTPLNIRQMRHAQRHAERIRDRCLVVQVDPALAEGDDQQQCSSIVLVMSEEDAMKIINALEKPHDPS